MPLNEPKPPPVDAAGVAVPANEDNLLAVAAAKGELDPGLFKPPKGDFSELAKLPKPDALNLSSDVCGSDCDGLEVDGAFGFAAIAANGDSAEIFANPLPGGIWRGC